MAHSACWLKFELRISKYLWSVYPFCLKCLEFVSSSYQRIFALSAASPCYCRKQPCHLKFFFFVGLLIRCLYRCLIQGKVTVLTKSSWELWKKCSPYLEHMKWWHLVSGLQINSFNTLLCLEDSTTLYISSLIPQAFSFEYCRGMKINVRVELSLQLERKCLP